MANQGIRIISVPALSPFLPSRLRSTYTHSSKYQLNPLNPTSPRGRTVLMNHHMQGSFPACLRPRFQACKTVLFIRASTFVHGSQPGGL
jgi:hypothetical protein